MTNLLLCCCCCPLLLVLLPHFLTGAKLRVINFCTMLRAARIALALLSIFAIAYVLATPDPTDDVTGVLRPNHLGKAQGLDPHFVQPPTPNSVILPLLVPGSPTQRLTTFELVDLLCAYRC